jgi:hypothetical protein
MQSFNSSGCRSDIALQGGWDTHSSTLGLQTQQGHHLLEKKIKNGCQPKGPLFSTSQLLIIWLNGLTSNVSPLKCLLLPLQCGIQPKNPRKPDQKLGKSWYSLTRMVNFQSLQKRLFSDKQFGDNGEKLSQFRWSHLCQTLQNLLKPRDFLKRCLMHGY